MYTRWTSGSTVRSPLVSRAASTCFGRSSVAGTWDARKEPGTPSDVAVAGGDVDVEQVGHRTLIFNIPVVCEVADKARIERSVAVMRVEREQVVNIASEDDPLSDAINRLLGGENTWVRVALREPPFAQPREK
eukprot:3611014-Pleurochrysis_carterae.AAC.1